MTRFKRLTLTAAAALLLAAATGTYASPEGHGFMGVSLALMEHVDGADDGLYISRVYEDTGAERAGLKEHDRIISINGKPVSEYGDVKGSVLARNPGDVVRVVVSRDGDRKTFDVTLGEVPPRTEGLHKGPMLVRELQEDRPMIGVQAISLTPQLAEFYEIGGGALVTDVVEDGPAWRAGIRAGDVISRWNGQELSGMDDVYSNLSRAKAGDIAEIEVIRRDSVQQYSVELAKREEVEQRQFDIQLSGEEGPDMKFKIKLKEKRPHEEEK